MTKANFINPYINFDGKTEEAFNFYKSVLGGEIFIMRYKETAEAEKLSDSEKEKMMHMSLSIGDGTILMGTDVLESMGQKLHVGDNISLAINAKTQEDADRLYGGLSAGGTTTVPMQDMFWGDYFGMLTDKFGVQWMVSYNKNQQK